MKPMSLSRIAEVVGGELNTEAQGIAESLAGGWSVDSRAVSTGDVFVAIEGERVDGHTFVPGAIAAGASAALVTREVEGYPCIVVRDPVRALGEMAAWYRREVLTATVIGVTGSSGKTTTKDLISDVLEGNVVAAAGSFNTEVGVPLTILSADESTRFLVLEMGMRGLGHIRYLVEMAQPDIGVVLNVGTAHVGVMANPGEIAMAKGELAEGLPAHGFAVLNADDPQVASMAARTSASVVWFGTGADVDVAAEDVSIDEAGHPVFNLRVKDQPPVQVSMKLYGEHFVESALASAAVGNICGMSAPRIAEHLSRARAKSPWRMEVHTTTRGVTVISDVYNANPESMRAALKALRSMGARSTGARSIGNAGRTWAVLGEMRELGDLSVAEHDAIGRLVVRLDISRLVCVGPGTKVMHLAASNEGSWGDESVWVPDSDAAIALLDAEVESGDTVLIKASRAVGLERIAEHLLDVERHAS